MSALADLIREHFEADAPFDADAVAKEVWRRLEVDGAFAELLFPLLRGEVVRLRRERNRDLSSAWATELMAAMPRPKLPAIRQIDPHQTIATVRAGLSESLRQVIAEGELQFQGRTVLLRDATEADVEQKLQEEAARLQSLTRSVVILRQLKSYFSLGIRSLGELL